MVRPPAYARGMDTMPLEEQAALVALLRERPIGMSWGDLTAEVLEAGSARDVWDRLVPPMLLDSPDAPGPLEEARRDIRVWTEDQRHTVTTIIDTAYPVRLRGIHQAPRSCSRVGCSSPTTRRSR